MLLQENGPADTAKLASVKACTQPATILLRPPAKVAEAHGQPRAGGPGPQQAPQPMRQPPATPGVQRRAEAAAAGPAAEQQQPHQSPPVQAPGGPLGADGAGNGPYQPAPQQEQTPRAVASASQPRMCGSNLGVFSPDTPTADVAEEAVLAQLEAAALARRAGAPPAAADPGNPAGGAGAASAARPLGQAAEQQPLAAAAGEGLPRLADTNAQPDALAAQHPQQLRPPATGPQQALPGGLLPPVQQHHSAGGALGGAAAAAQPAAEGVGQLCQVQAAPTSTWAATGGLFSDSDDNDALLAEVEALECKAS